MLKVIVTHPDGREDVSYYLGREQASRAAVKQHTENPDARVEMWKYSTDQEMRDTIRQKILSGDTSPT